ncbi:MAG: hypothetical protein M1823_008369, partial [Watsoniomyces obsoletus]
YAAIPLGLARPAPGYGLLGQARKPHRGRRLQGPGRIPCAGEVAAGAGLGGGRRQGEGCRDAQFWKPRSRRRILGSPPQDPRDHRDALGHARHQAQERVSAWRLCHPTWRRLRRGESGSYTTREAARTGVNTAFRRPIRHRWTGH